MLPMEPVAVSFDEGLSCSADDVGHLQRRPAHLFLADGLVVDGKRVQRTGGGVEALYSQVHVNQGVFEIFMPEQDLNGAEIRAGFLEMCRKTMAKSVGMNAFLEAGALGGFLTCVPNGFRIDGPILTIVAGEQPGAGFAMVEAPMGAECRE